VQGVCAMSRNTIERQEKIIFSQNQKIKNAKSENHKKKKGKSQKRNLLEILSFGKRIAEAKTT
jgi:hypothetical protein